MLRTGNSKLAAVAGSAAGQRIPRVFSTAALLLLAVPSLAADPIDLDLVTISDTGNIGYYGGPFGINAGRGSVDYEYRIGRTEITAGHWLTFYNTFAVQSNELAQTLRSPVWPARPGIGGRYVFTPNVLHPEIAPVSVSWRQAAMFCNWLHNGQSSDPASLLNGAYDTSTFTYNDHDNTVNDQTTHHPDARYWIPSLDEWLKAAHYDPNKNGQGPGWWEFAHSSDQPPNHGMPGEGDVGRDLTDAQLIQLVGTPNLNYIPLGIYDTVQSPWGLLDLLGGNPEFVEDWDPDAPHFWRLAKLSGNGLFTSSGTWDEAWFFQTWFVNTPGGFRIAAAVPGPSSAVCVLVALGVTSTLRRRRDR